MNRTQVSLLMACVAAPLALGRAATDSHPRALVGAWWQTPIHQRTAIFQFFADGHVRVDYQLAEACTRRDPRRGVLHGQCYSYATTQRGTWAVRSATRHEASAGAETDSLGVDAELCVTFEPGRSKWAAFCSPYAITATPDYVALRVDRAGQFMRLDSVPRARPLRPSFTADP